MKNLLTFFLGGLVIFLVIVLPILFFGWLSLVIGDRAFVIFGFLFCGVVAFAIMSEDKKKKK